jgi:uncharacterized protein YcbK (DUF882 family)
MSAKQLIPGAQHFYLHEFACKDGTPYPAEWITDRLCPLADILESIRHELAVWVGSDRLVKMEIISGYRTPKHNRSVKGARNSQHLAGRAADVECYVRDPGGLWREVDIPTAWKLAQSVHSRGMRIGGLGAYPNGKNGSPGFLHVDTRPGRLWRAKP